jgi:hypothetical protein
LGLAAAVGKEDDLALFGGNADGTGVLGVDCFERGHLFTKQA